MRRIYHPACSTAGDHRLQRPSYEDNLYFLHPVPNSLKGKRDTGPASIIPSTNTLLAPEQHIYALVPIVLRDEVLNAQDASSEYIALANKPPPPCRRSEYQFVRFPIEGLNASQVSKTFFFLRLYPRLISSNIETTRKIDRNYRSFWNSCGKKKSIGRFEMVFFLMENSSRLNRFLADS